MICCFGINAEELKYLECFQQTGGHNHLINRFLFDPGELLLIHFGFFKYTFMTPSSDSNACHKCTHEYTQTQIHGSMVFKSNTQVLKLWFPMSIFDKYSQVFCDFSGKIHSKLILRS
jgi:hypothetical protein